MKIIVSRPIHSPMARLRLPTLSWWAARRSHSSQKHPKWMNRVCRNASLSQPAYASSLVCSMLAYVSHKACACTAMWSWAVLGPMWVRWVLVCRCGAAERAARGETLLSSTCCQLCLCRQNKLFSHSPLTALQCRNRSSAPTTQTRHHGKCMVQWGPLGYVMGGHAAARRHFLNLHARRVDTEFGLHPRCGGQDVTFGNGAASFLRGGCKVW